MLFFELLIFHLLQFLLLPHQLLVFFLVQKRVSSMLFFLHDCRFERVFLRFLTPSCHLGFCSTVVLHACSLSLMDSFFLGEFLPFRGDLLFRQSFTSWKHCGDLGELEIKF